MRKPGKEVLVGPTERILSTNYPQARGCRLAVGPHCSGVNMSERVKVAIRINPNHADGIFEPAEVLTSGDGYKLTIKGEANEQQDFAKKRQFDGTYEVDDVFEGDVSQSEVWERFDVPVMEKVFDPDTGHVRFGVTIMAYGQTGSGKTFTMMGPESCKAEPLEPSGDIKKDAGLCLRLCHSLFKHISENSSKFDIYTRVTVGLLELYNEKMFDLLAPVPGNDPDK